MVNEKKKTLPRKIFDLIMHIEKIQKNEFNFFVSEVKFI